MNVTELRDQLADYYNFWSAESLDPKNDNTYRAFQAGKAEAIIKVIHNLNQIIEQEEKANA
jgi:hypothetical protein